MHGETIKKTYNKYFKATDKQSQVARTSVQERMCKHIFHCQINSCKVLSVLYKALLRVQ